MPRRRAPKRRRGGNLVTYFSSGRTTGPNSLTITPAMLDFPADRPVSVRSCHFTCSSVTSNFDRGLPVVRVVLSDADGEAGSAPRIAPNGQTTTIRVSYRGQSQIMATDQQVVKFEKWNATASVITWTVRVRVLLGNQEVSANSFTIHE